MSSSFDDDQLEQLNKIARWYDLEDEREERREQQREREREAAEEQARQDRLQARRDLEHRASRMDTDALKELGREKLAEKQLGHKLYETDSQQEQRNSLRQAQLAQLQGLTPEETINRLKNGDFDEAAGTNYRAHQPADPNNLTRADLEHMTAQQIVDANKTGKLDHLTGRN